jgi:hypothetical protein
MGKSICKRITTTNFCLHHEQTVNRLRKIAQASIFRLMSPRLHASISPCFHVYMSPFLHFSKFPCLHAYASMPPCLHITTYPCLHLSMCTEFGKRKIELTKNAIVRFFTADKKRKRKTSAYLLQTEMETGSSFSLVGKDKR